MNMCNKVKAISLKHPKNPENFNPLSNKIKPTATREQIK